MTWKKCTVCIIILCWSPVFVCSGKRGGIMKQSVQYFCSSIFFSFYWKKNQFSARNNVRFYTQIPRVKGMLLYILELTSEPKFASILIQNGGGQWQDETTDAKSFLFILGRSAEKAKGRVLLLNKAFSLVNNIDTHFKEIWWYNINIVPLWSGVFMPKRYIDLKSWI